MRRYIICLLLILIAAPICLIAQQPEREPITRAKKPKFDRRDTDGVFFKNVFEEGLIGERPENLASAAPKVNTAGTDSTSGTPETTGGSFPWTKLIAAIAIEDEVKAIKISLDTTVTTPNKFASGGAKEARVDYSMLAMLFAIISEYDGDVKWKKGAAAARDAFARCADNASTSSEIAFQQAKLRKADLSEILRGGGSPFDAAEDEANDWTKICDRSPLMERLEHSYSKVLKPGTASAGEFKSRKDTIMQEANLVAAISEVLTKEGMEDAIEDEYAAFAHEMKKGAVDLQQAIKLDSVDSASKAVGMIGQACTKCHDDWQ